MPEPSLTTPEPSRREFHVADAARTAHLPKRQKGDPATVQPFHDRVQNHSAIWWHSEDTRHATSRVLTMWWTCPSCRRTQSPAVNSGMEPVGTDRQVATFDKQGQAVTPDAYLSAFVCRFCKLKWDVEIRRAPEEKP